MEGLHVKIIEKLKPREKSHFNLAEGILYLPKAGSFEVTIQEYDDELKLLNDKLATTQKGNQESTKQIKEEYDKIQDQQKKWYSLTPQQRIELKRDIKRHEYNKKSYEEGTKKYNKKLQSLQNSIDNLKNKYADVRWISSLVSGTPTFSKESFNTTFKEGVIRHTINFPKALEGGGFIYIEPYHYIPDKEKKDNNPEQEKLYAPQNTPPFGCFIAAAGTPEIITAEWKDEFGFNITEEVAFGSMVYLHIYTAGLYGQELQIKLVDTYRTDATLQITETDKDGRPIQKLDHKVIDTFVKKVEVHAYDPEKEPQLDPPDNAATASLVDEVLKKSYPNIQKCVFPVFIEPGWQLQGAGNNINPNFIEDKGTHLKINPIIYHTGIKDGKIDLEDCILEVDEEADPIYNKAPLNSNSVVTIDESSASQANDGRTRKDFTFGIFIDGTSNNSYNTKAREAFEKRTGIIANAQEDVDKYKEKKYRYKKDSSYENGPSNPAILYENYKDDPSNQTHLTFKIYTEGIGTWTTPDENGNLNVKDYENDDIIGGGLGLTAEYQKEGTGIITKVRKTIEKMASKMLDAVKDKKETIGTITIDIFGFSRGAAAARNFVHEITLDAYKAILMSRGPNDFGMYYDHNGYSVSSTYNQENPLLPKKGYLGYLLTEANKTFDNLTIRFAGLFDTVPHHGFNQKNDVKDLGLDSINKANYVVHLVADDEHRYNFSLAKISSVKKVSPDSGQSGGIELYLPGVHSDIGGDYVEGRGEKNKIDADPSYQKMRDLRQELIAQGWFKEDELRIYDAFDRECNDENYQNALVSNFLLKSDRKYISNQYGLIPLHIMADFCLKKQVPIDHKPIDHSKKLNENDSNLVKRYGFRNIEAIPDNVSFLYRIEKRLYEYAFKGGEKYIFEKTLKQAIEVLKDYAEKEIKGKEQLDQAKAKNKDIKLLRNKYLHWNSTYGSSFGEQIIEKNKPRIVKEKRKRDTI